MTEGSSLAFLEALARIPSGQTRSFMELARMAGRPGAARAAGRAIAACSTRSPLAWHRVVYADGGFARDPEKSREQRRRLLEESARPKPEESIAAWARRREAHWVADYRSRLYRSIEDPTIETWHPDRVEPLLSEREAESRGFTLEPRGAEHSVVPLPAVLVSDAVGREPDADGDDPRLELSASEAGDLVERGFFHRRKFLSGSLCQKLLDRFSEPALFERRVDMAPRGFGIGSYYYFSEPLPPPLYELRSKLYRELAPLAGAGADPFPAELAAFWDVCRAAGQIRTSSILLCYPAGGVNHPHRDIYGQVAFPFQALIVLNRRGRDFSGGEFFLSSEQTGEKSELAASDGDLVIFSSRNRWPKGIGEPPEPMRHGMNEVTSGKRYAVGLVFHLAR